MSADGAVVRQRDDPDVVDHHVGRAGLVRHRRVGRQQRLDAMRTRCRVRHQLEQQIGLRARQQVAQLQPREKPRHVVGRRRVARIAGVAHARGAQRGRRDLRDQTALELQRPLRLRRRIQHAVHLERDVAFVAVHVDRVEPERPQPAFDHRRAAHQLQHGIGRRVVTLDDHQFQQFARTERHAAVRMTPRQRAARPDVARENRHLTIQRQRAL